MPPISYTEATDGEVLQEVGRRLRLLREAQGLTAIEAAARTGLSRRTVWRAELGDNPTLGTLLKLLRLYGRIEALDTFLREPEISPMALLKEQTKAQAKAHAKTQRKTKRKTQRKTPSKARLTPRPPPATPDTPREGAPDA